MQKKLNRRPIVMAVAAALLSASQAAAQSDPAPPAPAPTPAELIEALRSKPTRGPDFARSASQIAEAERLVALLKDKTTRGLSVSTQERQQLSAIITAQPTVNLEVGFEFNSSKLKPEARTALTSLGLALKNGQLSGADILIAGHTDAKGRPPVNQWLSERRAASVRAFLVKAHGLPKDKLITVGYGSERLKTAAEPFADENRRVEIVNLTK